MPLSLSSSGGLSDQWETPGQRTALDFCKLDTWSGVIPGCMCLCVHCTPGKSDTTIDPISMKH
eukprot:1161625-Pelagomonas_calceolata.AAC.22